MRFTLEVDNGFLRDVRSNCAQFYVGGVRPRGTATTAGGATFGLDVAGRRGEARASGAEWQIGPGGAAWLRFSELGVRLDGSRAWITAIVNPSRGVPRGRRQRIAVIRGARIDEGTINGQASTYRARVIGRLALLGPMAREVQRLRCRRAGPRRMRTGRVAGEITVDLRPGKASGVEGTTQVTVEAESESGAVTVEPAGPFSAPITAGLPVPMVCNQGFECWPGGGTFSLGVGFDLVNGGARASVTNLAVSTAGTSPQDVVHTITGTLDGLPVTIVSQAAPDVASGWTEDFAQRVSTILGTNVAGRLGVRARFSRTGP